MYSLEYEGVIFLAGAIFMLILNLLVQIGTKIKLGKKNLKILELEEQIDELQHQLVDNERQMASSCLNSLFSYMCL